VTRHTTDGLPQVPTQTTVDTSTLAVNLDTTTATTGSVSVPTTSLATSFAQTITTASDTLARETSVTDPNHTDTSVLPNSTVAAENTDAIKPPHTVESTGTPEHTSTIVGTGTVGHSSDKQSNATDQAVSTQTSRTSTISVPSAASLTGQGQQPRPNTTSSIQPAESVTIAREPSINATSLNTAEAQSQVVQSSMTEVEDATSTVPVPIAAPSTTSIEAEVTATQLTAGGSYASWCTT